jgi:hypothetical protein
MRPLKVISHPARDARVAKTTGHIVSTRLGPPLKFPQNDLAMIEMMYDTRFDPVEADKAKPPHNPVDRPYCRKLFLVPQPIL